MSLQSTQSTGSGGRYRYIDALRVLAVFLLLFFHSARPFVQDPWHVMNAEGGLFMEGLISFLSPWHMPLLFLLAGSGTYLALRVRSFRTYLGERVSRLLVPLLFGILVVVPPQIYLERIGTSMPNRLSPIDFSGTFLDFYPQFFRCCYPEGNLSYHHLWFLAYLFIYSLAAIPVIRYLRGPIGVRHLGALAGWLRAGPRVFWLAVPLILIEWFLRWRFPNFQDFIHDWANNAHYFTIFFYGYLLVSDPGLLKALERNRNPALTMGVVFTLSWWVLEALQGPGIPWLWGYSLEVLFRGLAEWGWIIAFIGYGMGYLDRDSSLLRYTSRIAMPFYIWHQTVIVIVAFQVVQWPLGAGVKFLLICTISFPLTVLACEVFRLTPGLRFLVGIKTPKRATSR